MYMYPPTNENAMEQPRKVGKYCGLNMVALTTSSTDFIVVRGDDWGPPPDTTLLVFFVCCARSSRDARVFVMNLTVREMLWTAIILELTIVIMVVVVGGGFVLTVCITSKVVGGRWTMGRRKKL